MPDEPHRSHDTDPLADTQSSDSGLEAGGASAVQKRRAVGAGDVVGRRYELVEEIGEGGMATVFRARDRELRRDVAIKVLFPHLARRPEVVHRFHREARAAAGLEHANILRVYDVGGAEDTDPPYIVMELIRGHSLLAEIERRGPMLAEVVACVGALLADALAVAHAAGIIHRDVKPANVMVDPGRRSESGALHFRGGGRLLLADFGVARLETEDSLVTKTGALLGTPAYMSPEQAGGDTATTRSDLYSLGATLYQLATGSLPYSGSPAKVIAQIASGSMVSAVRRRTGVGPDLSRMIDRLMAADPSARPAKATDVAAELRAIASTGGLGDASDELAAYFADAEAFAAERTPKIVASVVAAAERALADDKLPRAIALADRAIALAPDDPAVTALVAKVTEGGNASKRRRVLVIVGGAAVLAAGATVGAMQLIGEPDRVGADAFVAMGDPSLDAGEAASAGDASTSEVAGLVDAGAQRMAMLVDAGGPEVASVRDVAVIGTPSDARIGRVRADAGTRPRPVPRLDAAPPDSARVAPRLDAGLRPPAPLIDAAVARPVDAAVAPAQGFIVVDNDTWCEVSIDGTSRGRASKRPLRVAAGTHTVTCEQPGTGNRWTRTVEVGAGATVVAEGTMLAAIAVTLGVDATIDGVTHRRGSVVQLRRGRHDLVIDGIRTYVSIARACTVRTKPEPGCY